MKTGRLISLIFALALLLSFSSCNGYKKFEYCEMGIALKKDFREYDSDGSFNAAYSDGKTIVGITRFSFVDCEEYGLLSTYSPEQLAKVYLYRLGEENVGEIMTQGDVPYFSYSAPSADGIYYFYMPTFYRTPYAYFVITFITPASRKDEGRVEFLDYISSVYILDEYV